jgi:hypothetical protein
LTANIGLSGSALPVSIHKGMPSYSGMSCDVPLPLSPAQAGASQETHPRDRADLTAIEVTSATTLRSREFSSSRRSFFTSEGIRPP